MSQSNDIMPPILGNRYQVQQTIGAGGMANVYKAWDMRLERPVAIKTLKQDYSQDEAFRERFRQEAKAAANLSHPNIVTVYDFGYDSGKLFIVMEYVPGMDLKTIIKRQGVFEVRDTLQLIEQACLGIGYAHRAGLVHCDVKPHNMLVSPDHRLKVTDFGIARALASIQPSEQSDLVWGSPLYFSPEQAAGGAPSPASDVYSIGVILYELLTGRLPFYSTDPDEISRQHRESIPIPPRSLNPAIPVALEQIILKTLSKEPSARYRTADQLSRILHNFLIDQPPSTPQSIISQQSSSAYSPPEPARPVVYPVPPKSNASVRQPAEIDWLSVFLGLIAFLLIGGLIPFWLYIYLTFNPPR